jgi:hypothetical protein
MFLSLSMSGVHCAIVDGLIVMANHVKNGTRTVKLDIKTMQGDDQTLISFPQVPVVFHAESLHYQASSPVPWANLVVEPIRLFLDVGFVSDVYSLTTTEILSGMPSQISRERDTVQTFADYLSNGLA